MYLPLLQAMGGWQDLSYQVNEVMSPKDPLTALVVNLTGVDPDDAFSTVPYEKGSAFLWYLEDTGEIKKTCVYCFAFFKVPKE